MIHSSGNVLLPAEPWQVFASKTIVPILSGLFVFAGLWLALVAMPSGDRLSVGIVWLVVVAEIAAWGALFSMLTKRPLVALTLSVCFAVGCGTIITSVFHAGEPVRADTYLSEALTRLGDRGRTDVH